jgi:hypothetical protein
MKRPPRRQVSFRVLVLALAVIVGLDVAVLTGLGGGSGGGIFQMSGSGSGKRPDVSATITLPIPNLHRILPLPLLPSPGAPSPGPSGGSPEPSPSASAPTPTPTPSGTSSGGTTTGPVNGMLFGSSSADRNGMDRIDVYQALEKETDTQFNLHRIYYKWDDALPGQLLSWDVKNHKVPALSIVARTHDGKVVKWADIANGKQDATIRNQARQLKALGVPIILTFHHEPENDQQNGTPADYVAAWRHWVSIFRAEHVNNVSFAWIMMAYSFQKSSHRNPDAFYPGDNYVDWIAADGYNMAGCQKSHPWTSFANVFQPWRSWAASKHPSKPLFIAEWGSLEDPNNPNHKAQWISDALNTVANWPQVHAMSYFHSSVDCPWWLDSSNQAVDAFRQMSQAVAQDSAFRSR